jgi:hypothetical protein
MSSSIPFDDGALDRSDDEDGGDVKHRGRGKEEEEDEVHSENEDEEEVHSDNDDEEDEEQEDSDVEGVEEDTPELPNEEETATLMQQKQRLGLLDDDDLPNGDEYFKKFDPSLRFSMMEKYHPELLMENNTVVHNKTVIQRNEEGHISDPYHRTLPFLTKYEKARILGERAKQLNAGAKAMVDVPDHVIDGYLIALQEYEAKKIPFIIKRPLRNGECEYWKFCDLECL